MTFQQLVKIGLVLALSTGLAACGSKRNRSVNGAPPSSVASKAPGDDLNNRETAGTNYTKSSIWEAFGPTKTDQTVKVNRFIWNASLDVLSFLPVQSVDPFTGVIVTGYGTPPGGGRAYRATIYIKDPALDARSLNVALQTRGGPVSAATARAVEDAILSRARQMRIADNRF